MKRWMQKQKKNILIYRILLSVAWLYGTCVRLRNWMFDCGILHTHVFPVPVVCIGNLTVGGTGKTPHTEYLIRLLHKDFQVAVLSRGYKRKSKGFVLGRSDTALEEIGDEPYQMLHKFPDIYMAVDRNRCEGIHRLTNGHTAPGTKVILLDDAFQHRYVKAGVSILLIDYNRPVMHDALLPAGRLREPISGKSRADIIIVSKCPPRLGRDAQEALRKELEPNDKQQLFFTTLKYGQLRPLFVPAPERPLESLQTEEHILLLTGIASPMPLISKLSEYSRHVHPLTFPDHHTFDAADMRRIQAAFGKLPEGRRLLITTEKDASRLIGHPDIERTMAPYMYVLPVIVEFLNREEKSMFNQHIMDYVRKNSRNCLQPES